MQNTVSELCTFGCAVKDMNRLTPAELSWPGASYRFPLVLRNSARHSLQSHKDQCVYPYTLMLMSIHCKQSPNKPDSHTSLVRVYETTQTRQCPFPVYTCRAGLTDLSSQQSILGPPPSTCTHIHTLTMCQPPIPCRPSGPGQKGMGPHSSQYIRKHSHSSFLLSSRCSLLLQNRPLLWRRHDGQRGKGKRRRCRSMAPIDAHQCDKL